MIIGVIIGEFDPHVQQAFDTVRFDSVSVRTYTFIRYFCYAMSDLGQISYCYRAHSYDVANPHQNSIRIVTDIIFVSPDLDPNWNIPIS